MSKFSKLLSGLKHFVTHSTAYRYCGLAQTTLATLAWMRRTPLGRRDTELKEHLLRLRAWQLEMAGTHFNLRDRAERGRSTQELERLFFDILPAFQPMLFIEAGAKDAGTSRRARKCLSDATIVAFEANPFTFKCFDGQHDNAAVGVQYRNRALCAHEGTITVNVRRTEDGGPLADGRASLLKREDYGPGHLSSTVPATTLDHVLAEFEATNCVLWVDVEGACEQVLSGGYSTLRSALAVFIEVEDRQFWPSQWIDTKVSGFLYEADLIPVARDFQSRHQYNVLFVKRSLLSSPPYRRALAEYQSRIGPARSRWGAVMGVAKQRQRMERALLAWLISSLDRDGLTGASY
jgi:FkbM family methyltransferase